MPVRAGRAFHMGLIACLGQRADIITEEETPERILPEECVGLLCRFIIRKTD